LGQAKKKLDSTVNTSPTNTLASQNNHDPTSMLINHISTMS
jgi:hypothetical protein